MTELPSRECLEEIVRKYDWLNRQANKEYLDIFKLINAQELYALCSLAQAFLSTSQDEPVNPCGDNTEGYQVWREAEFEWHAWATKKIGEKETRIEELSRAISDARYIISAKDKQIEELRLKVKMYGKEIDELRAKAIGEGK